MGKKTFDYYNMKDDLEGNEEIKKGKKKVYIITAIMVVVFFLGVGFFIYNIVSNLMSAMGELSI